jgi:two-component system response regulator AtoC
VDDEPDQRALLRRFLEKKGYGRIVEAGNAAEALKRFAELPVSLVLLDHRMPDMNGDELLERMREIHPLFHAIMITAYGAVDVAVRVMKLGAVDFFEKPVDLSLLLEKIQEVEGRVAVAEDVEAVAEAAAEAPLPVNLVGDGPAMRETLSLVRRVAPTPWPVLIRGETGTGKELIARLVHMLGPAPDGPFEAVNCGAIPENLFESELFGHEKGAFTGASGARRGRFETANGGALFLDEVGELPLSLQPKLLRALQDGRIRRVGGEREIGVNVRVVAATHRDLREMAAEGRFREDLYFRLNAFEVGIPPLRERREDLPALVDFFVSRYAARPVVFEPETLTALAKYPFPGNVRELEHLVQRAVTLARTSRIQIHDLPPEVRLPSLAQSGVLNDRLEAVEREMICAALDRCQGVQTRAAESLGISERVLRYKMGKHGISGRNG